MYSNRVSPVMHMEHEAGDKMYIDFAGDKLAIVDKESSQIKEVEVFAAILGCPQITYVEAKMSQRKEDLIGASKRMRCIILVAYLQPLLC